ncbi:hypothetical protein RB200_26855 [Streptomyces sp. PmtG]
MTTLVSLAVALSVVTAALCVVPDAVRELVPRGWWVHREGLVGSLWMAGVAVLVSAATWALTLYEHTPLAPPEHARHPRPRWGERVRGALRHALSSGVAPLVTVVFFVLGAAARFTSGFAAVPPEGWYALGAAVAFCGWVALSVDTPRPAYGSGRGLAACVAMPAFTWATEGLPPWARLVALGAAAALVFTLLRGDGVMPRFVLMGGFVTISAGSLGPGLALDGGFESGVVVGLAVAYAFGCAFLGPASGLRILNGIARLGRRVGWLSRPVALAGVLLIGLGAEVVLGFAGVVFIAVAYTATTLAGGLARVAMPLTGAATGRVPPRPGPFLAWAYHAGLLRVVGGTYEFRHRELQDWLNRDRLIPGQPLPPPR